MTVFACKVPGASSQVLPPSVEYCHSYEDLGPADFVASFADPDTGPASAPNALGLRAAVFFTLIAALSMMETPFSTLASAVDCT